MNPVSLVLATAGHVDHGKSSLVHALTGVDPDRLPEEKARGITIDLGFAHTQLDPAQLWPNENSVAVGTGASTYSLGLIDVPGHEDFVKNMVAGVGSIDLALLVVAADDGWMPQTEEHLQILCYLGLRHAVVALTKADATERSLDLVAAEIRAELSGTPLAEAAVIPTSIRTGLGLLDLRQALWRASNQVPRPADLDKPRLPIDRAFVVGGIGTVVTGTLTGGNLRVGDPVVLQPAGCPGMVRSMQCYGQDVVAAGPGMRVALHVPEFAGRPAEGRASSGRGQVVTRPDCGDPTTTLDVWLEKTARWVGRAGRGARPLKNGMRVRLHHGSGQTGARLVFLEGATLEPGQGVLAQVRCDRPIVMWVGDRFIVRDEAQQATLAGGVVLESESSRRHLRSGARVRALRAQATAPDDLAAVVRSVLARREAVSPATWMRGFRFGAGALAGMAARLVHDGEACTVGEFVVSAAAWTAWLEQVRDRLAEEHRLHPESPGLTRPMLQHAMARVLPDAALLEPLLKALAAEDMEWVGEHARLRGFRPALPAALQAGAERLRQRLRLAPLDPPSRTGLVSTPEDEQALRFLVRTGEMVALNSDVLVLSETYIRMTSLIRVHLRRHGRATVSELRQAVGTSRRVLVPLLERLDREGVTRREGDVRVLRPRPSGTPRA